MMDATGEAADEISWMLGGVPGGLTIIQHPGQESDEAAGQRAPLGARLAGAQGQDSYGPRGQSDEGCHDRLT